MFIGVRRQIMAFILKISGQRRKISVEITGQEKGAFHVVLFHRFTDNVGAIGKFVPGEDQRDFLFGRISPNDSAQHFLLFQRLRA